MNRVYLGPLEHILKRSDPVLEDKEDSSSPHPN